MSAGVSSAISLTSRVGRFFGGPAWPCKSTAMTWCRSARVAKTGRPRPTRARRRTRHTYGVDRPKVTPMAEATGYFPPREQRLHLQFHVDCALQVRQRPEAHR